MSLTIAVISCLITKMDIKSLITEQDQGTWNRKITKTVSSSLCGSSSACRKEGKPMFSGNIDAATPSQVWWCATTNTFQLDNLWSALVWVCSNTEVAPFKQLYLLWSYMVGNKFFQLDTQEIALVSKSIRKIKKRKRNKIVVRFWGEIWRNGISETATCVHIEGSSTTTAICLYSSNPVPKLIVLYLD